MRIHCIVIIVAVLLLLSCGKVEQNEFTGVIQRNLDAMNNEDLAASMATIHEESPLYDNTEDLTAQLFQMYDLSFKLGSCKVVSQTPEEVTLEAVQITKKVNGPQFQNNRSVIIHTLRRSNGIW